MLSLQALSNLRVFLALVIITYSHQALASSCRLAETTSDQAATAPPTGICHTAEIIHGYECHEFDVRYLL